MDNRIVQGKPYQEWNKGKDHNKVEAVEKVLSRLPENVKGIYVRPDSKTVFMESTPGVYKGYAQAVKELGEIFGFSPDDASGGVTEGFERVDIGEGYMSCR